MSGFLKQMKWQFILLQKNNIIGISFGVTLVYGIFLYALKGIGDFDKFLVAMVLSDPSVIGYFFIALAIYTEMKHQVLQAIFVSPVNIHQLLISKALSISIIGVVCSLVLALSVKGFDFDIATYIIGSFGLCILSTLLGLSMLTFADEFLKFSLLSAPVFLVFLGIPFLQYLGVKEIGMVKYLFPIQGSVDLIDNAIRGTVINRWYSYLSLVSLMPLLYLIAFRLFTKKIVYR
jgi:fluoroquinolone transport system permease protein